MNLLCFIGGGSSGKHGTEKLTVCEVTYRVAELYHSSIVIHYLNEKVVFILTGSKKKQLFYSLIRFWPKIPKTQSFPENKKRLPFIHPTIRTIKVNSQLFCAGLLIKIETSIFIHQ